MRPNLTRLCNEEGAGVVKQAWQMSNEDIAAAVAPARAATDIDVCLTQAGVLYHA